MLYSRKTLCLHCNVEINCWLNFILRCLLTSRVLHFLLRGCSEENIKTFGDLLCLELEHGIAPVSPGGGDICYKILAVTQGLLQAFVRAVCANVPRCPGVDPPRMAAETCINSSP